MRKRKVVVELTPFEARALHEAGSNYTAPRRHFTQARAARKLQDAMIRHTAASRKP